MNNKEFFNRKFGELYTPDNSEGIEDNYTFEDLEKEAIEFWNEYHNEISYDNIDLFIKDIISSLHWQFPSTVMLESLYQY